MSATLEIVPSVLDRIRSCHGELTVLGQHLQRWPVEPDPAHVTPQCAIQVDRRPTTLIRPAQLQRGVAAEGVSKRA